MQLSRFALFALPVFAIAGVIVPPSNSDTDSDKCFSGALLCCGKMADPSHPDGPDPDDTSSSDGNKGKIGLQCYPIQLVVGGLENPCAAVEVCCSSYKPDRLIGYGCAEDFNA